MGSANLQPQNIKYYNCLLFYDFKMLLSVLSFESNHELWQLGMIIITTLQERNLDLEKLNVLSNITQLVCSKLKTQGEFFWL